jgi:hypothetical protein
VMSDPDEDHSTRVLQQIVNIIGLVITAIIPTILQVIKQYYLKEPYYTSILSGWGWVHELRNGHPERIRTELGVHKHVFDALIFELLIMGYHDSKNVTIEEQLAIFLYMCVTGLTVCHAGERFQRSNATISKYFIIFLVINYTETMRTDIFAKWSIFFHFSLSI